MSSEARGRLVRSRHLSVFGDGRAVFVYHELWGHVIELGEDGLALLDAFAGGAELDAVIARQAGALRGARELTERLLAHGCLVPPGARELDAIWTMVPLVGRWNVWKRAGEGQVLYTAWGHRPLQKIALDRDQTALLAACDGEKPLAELRAAHDPDLIVATVRLLASSDAQALKLSRLPVSAYRHGMPAHLTATMPHPPYRGDAAERSEPGTQLEHLESTLAHLLRVPHPALAGRSYGRALLDALAERAMLPARSHIRVLEIGGGLGHLARDLCQGLLDHGYDVRYEIASASRTLASAQRARVRSLPVSIREGHGLEAPVERGGYDLIVANEVAAGLPTRRFSHRDRDSGELPEYLDEYGLDLSAAPDPFELGMGAFELVRRIAGGLASGGHAVVIDLGTPASYPHLAGPGERQQLSLHFGQLEAVARASGLRTAVEPLVGLLDVDRSLEGLATTRGHFRALAALLAERGITLEKIGYTRAMFEDLIAGKLPAGSFGEVRFENIEDRLMSQVPRAQSALLLSR